MAKENQDTDARKKVKIHEISVKIKVQRGGNGSRSETTKESKNKRDT